MAAMLILGCGNMGGAMLEGWLRHGADPALFTVVDPHLAAAPPGVRLLRAVPAGERFATVLLGVKPQALDTVAPVLAPVVGPDCLLLSILAGVELASLAARFPGAGGIVRVMPNLSVAIGKSPIGLAAGPLDDGARARVAELMAPLGSAEWLDEGLMDAVTALAGSGPAFVYRFIDALAAAGAELGLAPDQARRLATAMIDGAGALAASTPLPPDELARRVTSPGGTTAAGLAVLDADGALARLLATTLRAARDRGAEMAAAARNP